MRTISADTTWTGVDFKEIWHYRELLYFLAWREIKIRYKQTALGAAWAILQPLMTVATFSIFFGRWAKMPSDGIPYPVFALAGLLPWTLFANTLVTSSNSLVGNSHLISKVYFPRLFLPTSTLLSAILDFLVSLSILGLAMFYFGVPLSFRIVALPGLLLITAAASLGAGFFLSALNVRFRDVRHTVPFLTQIWMFASPIAYPVSIVPAEWRQVYALNPMVGVVEGFRWALFKTNVDIGPVLLVSSLSALVFFFLGMLYFSRAERDFADVV
jgi:lipopolysaccharide transport system permease protein